MKIEVDEKTIEAIEKLYDRYYFGLFKQIVKNEDEEYELRDALSTLVKAIQESKS